MEHDQLRTVGQGLDGLERDGLRAVLYAPGQGRAGAGEPDPAVHGEEAAVGEVEDTGGEASFELVGQGVLALVVAADRGADPAEGRRAAGCRTRLRARRSWPAPSWCRRSR